MEVQAVITGVTGMVGEGVLHECLLHSDVEKVLVVNRKPCGVSHPSSRKLYIQIFRIYLRSKANWSTIMPVTSVWASLP